MTSFFLFVNKRAIYRLGIISLAHAPVHVTRPTKERDGWVSRANELLLRVQTNKQAESCFLNHNSSINLCCTDSFLMIDRGGHRLSIIIWRIGGGGPNILLAALHVTDFPVFASGSG